MAQSSAEIENYNRIIDANSPWQVGFSMPKEPKPYKREAYETVQMELDASHGMAVLIKGPRRVGKTEIQRQLISMLLRERGVPPKNVLYLSFDDLGIVSEDRHKRAKIVQAILDTWAKRLGADSFDRIAEKSYCFFDEVQAVDDWAHLVKNRVERNPRVRIVLSGSAAHSIFEKALEILLGRVIDVRLTTFSFREILEMRELLPPETLARTREIQKSFERTLDPVTLHAELRETLSSHSESMRAHVDTFLADGGFPQLWDLDRIGIERAQFVDEHYVKKVTLEDLMLLQQIKKPELYERLLRHLFARPGQEHNQNKIASDLGTTAVTLAEAMRLLKQTDLLIFVERLTTKAEPLKVRNVKIYPIDLMLTYAMTKLAPSLEAAVAKGMIAESLVAQTAYRLRGLSSISYMESKDVLKTGEIDFFLRSDMRDCAIEVKFQSEIRAEDTALLRKVVGEIGLKGGLLITPDSWESRGVIYNLPLWAFMLVA
jgi:uncharacterized protein